MKAPKVIKGKDGATYILGDVGVEVGQFQVRVGKKIVAETEAFDSFEFGMTRLGELLTHATSVENHLVKTTISQLAIVALASLLEAYGKKRMAELEAQDKVRSWDAILNGTHYTLENLKTLAKENARSPIEQLLEERKLNLNDLNEFGRLFEQGFAMKISDLDRSDIYRIIELRHKIVHGGLKAEILYDAKEGKPPVFALPETARGYMNKTKDFVGSVHERTLGN